MLKKIITLLFLLLTAIFLTGCGGTSSKKVLSPGSSGIVDELTAGRIQGKVTQYNTDTPIKNAIVEVGEIQGITDEKGQYNLGPINPGDYRVVARARGYEVTMQDPVRVYSGKITENINFQLLPQGKSYAPDFAIISVNPTMGGDGDSITIYCRGCGNTPGEVTFNGKKAQIIDWNSTQDGRILVLAPENLESGPIRVLIEGNSSNEPQYFYFIAKPAILRADPSIAKANDTITIYGRNFNPISRFNTVKLAGDNCYVNTVPNHTTMSVTLPANAKTGNLSIEINSDSYTLEGTSQAQITIIPQLLHMAPKRAVPSTPTNKPKVTLYGRNFGTDRNLVQVVMGAAIITPADFLSFSDTSISFYAPNAQNLSPGTTTDVKVKVNDSLSNPLKYTVYNDTNATLAQDQYGFYDFENVSQNNKLSLPMLRPSDRLVFISVLSASSIQDVNETESYTISSYLGGNYQPIPQLAESIRQALPAVHPYNKSGDPAANPNTSPFYSPSNSRENVALAPSISKSFPRQSNPNHMRGNSRSFIRGAISEPAEEEIELFLRDFTSEDPWDAENDILATATLIATGTKTAVYYDKTQSSLNKENAQIIAEKFDEIYSKLHKELGLLDPPEGNIDDQKRIIILMSPQLEKAKPVLSSYFDPRDKNPQALNSAGTEIIYAAPSVFRTNSTEFFASLAQSLNQMFYYNQKHVAGVYYGSPWQEAGLSTLARQIAGYGFEQNNQMDLNRVSDYLAAPYKYSLDNWPESPAPGDYGLQFLMTSYLMEKFGKNSTLAHLSGTDDGSKLAKGLVDLEELLSKNGYTDFNDFFQKFCLALYCNGLKFDSSVTGLQSDDYKFSDVNLRQGSLAGLRGGSFGESPIDSALVDIKGNSCRLFMYPLGNWGDVETTINRTSSGVFKTWVLYYSTEQAIEE